ncbi:MAG TPA: AMP-binding protein [Casimicrobiaceae bacterium]|nr:AMP-binding protein [Casimicrobiaceae bacterium]
MTAANITDAIRRNARVLPDMLAILRPDGQRMPYRDFDAMIDAIVARLLSAGLQQGRTIALREGEPYRALVLALAAARLGVVVAPDSFPSLDACIIDAASEPIANVNAIHSEQAWWQSMPAQASAPPTPPRGEAPCRIFAARADPSRFVVVSHATMAARVRSDWLGISAPALGTLCCVDTGTESGFGALLAILTAGHTLSIASHVDQVVPAIATFRFDGLIIAAPLLQLLVEALPPNFAGLPSLRRLEIESTDLPLALLETVRKRLCANIAEIVRTPETGGIAATFGAHDASGRPIGFVHPDIDVEVVDSDNHSLTSGREGMLRVRGATYAFADRDRGNASSIPSGEHWIRTDIAGAVFADQVLRLQRASDPAAH